MTPDLPASRPRLALFDLDHTLLPLDSDYEWGEFTIRIGWNDRTEFGRRNKEFYDHYVAGTLNVHDYVRFAVDAARQRGPEAAAAAQPLISTDVGGINEIYGPRHRHRLIKANDPAILAEAIRTMLARSESERLAEAADLAAHVRQHFQLDDMVDGVIAAYRDALRARRGGVATLAARAG